jgi:LAS superfamily LD-carboxypeptidase LdcB
MNIEILLGKTSEHLELVSGSKCSVHKNILQDFLKLKKDAKEAGFDLEIASGFRDYGRQEKIWNAKASGERDLFDEKGNLLDYSTLSPREILNAILRWSAVPGASRHHWGTDMDVFDAHTQRREDVKLLPSECEESGPAAEMHRWLDFVIKRDKSYGFFRPYKTDRGGVSPERWHLSHYEISRRMMDTYTYSLFKKNIEESTLLLKDELLNNSHEIFEKYFLNIDMP